MIEQNMKKIYTKSGDDGQTCLASGVKVSKTDIRVCVTGELDELSAIIGLLLCENDLKDSYDGLVRIQHLLFEIGLLVSSGSKSDEIILQQENLFINELEILESNIDRMQESLPDLKAFVLPGGMRCAALAHLCRTTVRRLERSMWQLNSHFVLPHPMLAFINRLSDYFFVLALNLNFINRHPENIWTKR